MAPSNASGNGSSSKYYFLSTQGHQSSTRDVDGGEVVEGIPEGAAADEFAPKQLGPMPSPAQKKARQAREAQAAREQQPWWNKLFGRPAPSSSPNRSTDIGTLVKQRKAPIKIEPKVFFANERTFLAWMHLSVTLAGASIAILAFAQDNNPLSQMYGVILLPVAIAFIVYSMYQYARRATMIRTRHPGPYEDTTGPVVLGVMLMTSIVAQFALKLYALTDSA
eukprot:scaffold823_cov219-Amphora_coffeaeformis.AAC.15